VNSACLILMAILAVPTPTQPAESSVTTAFGPYVGVGYARASRFSTENMIYTYENLIFSGFSVNLGGRLTLTSGKLHTYAQVDISNLERLSRREKMVSLMVTQMTGWSVDILTLEAGFRYARTFDRPRTWSHLPVHEIFGGFLGARQYIGRFDYGLALGLIHRTGLLTDETELPAWVDVSCRLGFVMPYVGVGVTARRVWAFERGTWGMPVEAPLYASVGFCLVPLGRASDFPAHMLMPRDVFYHED